jgi:hypothetical protein
MAVEQRNGITFDRIKQIAADGGHGAEKAKRAGERPALSYSTLTLRY